MNANPSQGEKFIPFDVVSLFPNVSIDTTVNMPKEFLEQNHIPPDITEEYLRLTQICMDLTVFSFNNNHYQQIFGTATRMTPQFPKCWAGYMDINRFLNFIYKQYPLIKFTHEEAINNTIPPLDLKITITVRSRVFPFWKICIVTFVFKKGHRSNIENHRPVIVPSAYGQVLEILLYRKLYCCVQAQLSDRQHGFLRDFSGAFDAVKLDWFLRLLTSFDDIFRIDLTTCIIMALDLLLSLLLAESMI
ncbi:hypothetical protein Trydic_g9087 [Trypoxylus dichotomus]